MTQKGRIGYIDLAKFIAVFLMVLCHSNLHCKYINVPIYAFHMPFFFFVSGYITGLNKGRTFKEEIELKIKKIIIPYLLFALIYSSDTSASGLLSIFWGSRNSLLSSGSFTPLWFLPCYFCASIIYFLIKKVQHRKIIYYSLLTICGLLGFLTRDISLYANFGMPFSINIALTGVVLMILGQLYREYIDGLKYSTLFGVWGGVIAIYLSFFNTPPSLDPMINHIEMSQASYGCYVFFLLNASLLSVGLLSLCKGITKSKSVILHPFMYLGNHSLVVLCTHRYGLMIFPYLFKPIKSCPLVYSLAIALCTVALSYLIIKIILKFIPSLVGR